MTKEKNDNALPGKGRQNELLEELEANRQKLVMLEKDVVLKSELLAKLNAEKEELNRLYPGAGRKQ